MPALDPIVLPTQRLILRPLQANDAPALFAIFSDPVVMRYWSHAPWSTLEQAHALIERAHKALPTGDFLTLGIERQSDALVIGTCTLHQMDVQCRRAEIGYGMRRSEWGQGYMHEALSTFLEHGFSALQLNRIEADIDPRNQASARSLLRLGFQPEGLLRERWIVEGEVSDSALYGLLHKDWQTRTQS